jgi:uncharacterized protein
MIAKLFDVRDSKNGKGLFAKEFIPKGTIVAFECPNDKIYTQEEIDAFSDKEKDLIYNQIYRKDDGTYLRPHDDNVYMNHACDPNVLNTGLGFEIVVKDISKGEAVTCDYRVYNDIEKQSFKCNCGSDDCCGYVRCQRPIDKILLKLWKHKVDIALKNIVFVDQPLRSELIEMSNSFEKFFVTKPTDLTKVSLQQPHFVSKLFSGIRNYFLNSYLSRDNK